MLPGRVACGQLRWDGPGDLRIRHALAAPGHTLIPASDGRFHAEALSDARVDPQTLPDPDALRCLRVMGHGIGRRIGEPLLEWLAEPPLMPPVDDTLDETELEQVARAKLPHMEAACRRPRTHLKLEEERQLVSRCRRPSSRAPIVLASHSEDWDRRTLWGIRPKRVLGLVREDLFDLYENRLAVALVDRLDEALTQRVREVRRVVQQARSMEEWQELLESGSNYRRARRVCSLWGELWSDEGLLARAERALGRLLQLRRRVLALKDTGLYRRIGGRKGVIHLRMTNVLTHDDVYRGVAELWQAWERHVLIGQEDPQTRWNQEQEAVEGMRLYAVLLVVRALDVLGFEPTDASIEVALCPGAQLELKGPLGTIRLVWGQTGTVEVEQLGHPSFHVSALPAMLEGSPGTGAWLEGVEPTRTIVLHLEADVARAPLPQRIRLRGPGPADGEPIFVPVAPWQLESVERLARALRWRLWLDRMCAYPTEVRPGSNDWRAPARPLAWITLHSDGLRVVAPPRAAGWPDLERRIEEAQREVDSLQAQLDAIDPRDPRRTRDKLHLKNKRAQAARALAADQAVRDSLDQAGRSLTEQLTCPVCHHACSQYRFEHVERRFRVSCSACDSTWGLRDCSACGGLFPFIDCPDNTPGADPLSADTAYGCDVLALPVAPEVYLCTQCGQRSDGEPDEEA